MDGNIKDTPPVVVVPRRRTARAGRTGRGSAQLGKQRQSPRETRARLRGVARRGCSNPEYRLTGRPGMTSRLTVYAQRRRFEELRSVAELPTGIGLRRSRRAGAGAPIRAQSIHSIWLERRRLRGRPGLSRSPPGSTCRRRRGQHRSSVQSDRTSKPAIADWDLWLDRTAAGARVYGSSMARATSLRQGCHGDRLQAEGVVARHRHLRRQPRPHGLAMLRQRQAASNVDGRPAT